MDAQIREQIDLSNRIAFGIVVQGFRIRMGRSVITLLGVIFGIAFLMSNLTNQIVRDAVQEEEQLRLTVKRMMSFLVVETGPLPGKTVILLDRGERSVADGRFEAALRAEGATLTGLDARQSAHAIVVLGAGGGPVAWESIPPDIPVAVSSTDFPAPADRAVIRLLAPPTDEEIAQAESKRVVARTRYWWILAISVVVTFMGITNAMLMSVTERFREIGTMKCLGAKSKFIRHLFVIESLLLGTVGGVAGAAAGAVFSVAGNALVYGLPLVLTLDFGKLAGAGVLCVAVGAILAVVSALSPAHVAASMTPAHALRSNV